MEESHRLLATGTGRERRRGRRPRAGVAQLYRSAGMTLDAQALGPGRRMTEAVVADRTQAPRQDVPEVTRHELHAREGAGFPAVSLRTVLPAEADAPFIHLHHAAVGDGGAGDVGPEVLQRRRPVAGGLDVHAPVLGPDRRIDLPAVDLKERAQVFPEGGLQERQME